MITYKEFMEGGGCINPLSVYTICFKKTEISSLPNWVSKFKNLRDLDLHNTPITKIKGLGSLVNLKYLNLSHTEITKVNGLNNLVNLKWLNLEKTKITKLGGLKNLVNLERVYVEEGSKFLQVEHKGNFEIVEC